MRRSVITRLSCLGLVSSVAACDRLVTDPSLYASVDVTVVRRDGSPIAGADLILYTGQRPMGYGKTDSAGSHTFVDVPEGLYGVRAIPPAGYVRIDEFVLGGQSDAVDPLHVQRGTTLPVQLAFLKEGLGTVVAQISEPNGTPVAQVPVTLYGPSGALRDATTDAAGSVTFDNLPLGNYGVRASRTAAYRDSGETPLPSHDGILVDEGSSETASFVFTPCFGAVSALVRDNLGNPVPGAVLTLYGAQAIVADGQTGAGGARVFANLGCEEYGVRVRAPAGWTAPEGRGVSFNDGLRVHRGSTVSTTLTVLVVTCRGTLRVRVEDDQGTAVAAARVDLYTADGPYRNLLSAADGQAVFAQVPCGQEYAVRVTAPPGFSVQEGPGISFFDGLLVSDGLVLERVFRLVRN